MFEAVLEGMNMSKPIIELQGLTRIFNNQVAVDTLSIVIEQGEVFGFLGHNGAGKTTTVHMLTTLLPPSSGKAFIGGYSVQDDTLSVRRLIGYVPENVRLYDTLTARENLRFFARLSGVVQPEQTIDKTMELLECSDLLDKRVGEFSKGMRQRVGLAQAILHQPRVLFLDEPSSGLDPQGIKTLRELILRLNYEFGMTIFMNTHLLSEIAKTCTSIGVLNHGRLVYHGNMEAATQAYADESALEALYLAVNMPAVGAA